MRGQCVSRKDHIDIAFADHFGKCFVCPGMDDGRPTNDSNPAPFPADIKYLTCNLSYQGLTGAFWRDGAVHELKGTAPPGAFRIAYTDTLLTHNHQIPFSYFSQCCGHCPLFFRINNNKEIHFDRFDRDPFSAIFHLGRVVAGSVESLGHNTIRFCRNQICIFYLKRAGSKPVEF